MTWTMTRDNIIGRALEISGLKSLAVAAQSYHILAAADELNGIIEGLNSKSVADIQLEWVTKTLTASSVVTNGGKTYTCFLPHTASATDEPGVGAYSDKYWKETGTGGSAWVSGTAYTTIGVFDLGSDTLDVLVANIQDGDTQYKPMRAIDHLTWFGGNSSKTDLGLPMEYYIDFSSTPRMYLYFVPDKTTYLVHYYRVKSLLTLDDATSETELDHGWYHYLKLQLAALMGNYNQAMSTTKRLDLENQAKEALKDAKSRSFYRVATKNSQ